MKHDAGAPAVSNRLGQARRKSIRSQGRSGTVHIALKERQTLLLQRQPFQGM
jgi:hypothetical protein